MKLREILSVTIVAMAFFVAAGAAAKTKDSRNMLLHYDATIAGSRLGRGTYNVQWQTHTPGATVSFLRGSKVMVTAEGKVVDRGRKYSTTEVVYNESANGAHVIQELRFKGSSEVIVFNE